MRKFQGEQENKPRRKGRPYGLIVAGGLLGIIGIRLGIIPIRIALTKNVTPQPQAIFVLGSDLKRSELAVELWEKNRNMRIWVSDTQSLLPKQQAFFDSKRIPKQVVELNGDSTDTVTNFTTMVAPFKAANIQHVYLVTSASHMNRSSAIATIVFGSQGIIVTPQPLQETSETPWFYQENRWRTMRDCLRSTLWLFTGKTGASFNPKLKS
jgi:uncharacterized SAM-binding protein YcdF (DUF218 family)